MNTSKVLGNTNLWPVALAVASLLALVADPFLQMPAFQAAHPDLAWFSRSFLVPIAQSLLASAVIGIWVDARAKSDFIKDVAKESLPYILGYHLPKNVQRKLQEVIETKLVREDARLHLRFELFTNAQGEKQVRLTQNMSYRVVNYGNKDERFQQMLAMEQLDEVAHHFFACDSPPSAKYMENHVQRIDQAGQSEWLCPKALVIGPSSENDDYTFRMSFGMVKDLKDSEVHAFGSTVNGVTIEIQAPPELDYTIVPSAVEPNGNLWTMKQVFLPNQHVRIRWWPK